MNLAKNGIDRRKKSVIHCPVRISVTCVLTVMELHFAVPDGKRHGPNGLFSYYFPDIN